LNAIQAQVVKQGNFEKEILFLLGFSWVIGSIACQKESSNKMPEGLVIPGAPGTIQKSGNGLLPRIKTVFFSHL
jgi:hypothetical protein